MLLFSILKQNFISHHTGSFSFFEVLFYGRITNLKRNKSLHNAVVNWYEYIAIGQFLNIFRVIFLKAILILSLHIL